MTEAITATRGGRVVDGRQISEVGTEAIGPSHASVPLVARHLMARTRGSLSGGAG